MVAEVPVSRQQRQPKQTKRQIVAIDGPAGAGKSTVAKRVAAKLGFGYLDTGAMYRAITLKAMKEGVGFDSSEGLGACARNANLSFAQRAGSPEPIVMLDGTDITEAIRSPEVTGKVSLTAKEPGVRAVMTKLQRQIGEHGCWVVDGRDIGTVVFPDATTKVFLTASIEERARRRLTEQAAKGFAPTDMAKMAADIKRRDEIDSSRETAPLRAAEDAIHLDTTGLSIDQVVDRIIEYVTPKDGKHLSEEVMSNKMTAETQEKTNEPGEAKVAEKAAEKQGHAASAEESMNDSAMTMEELERSMEESGLGGFGGVRAGAILNGTVVNITSTEIYVDVGYKTEGVISGEEAQGLLPTVKKGDDIRVFVKRVDDNSGILHLSRKRAEERDAWDTIQEAFKNKTPVEACIKSRIKGGYDVSIGGVRGFLPQSQLSHSKNTKDTLGQSFPMLVIECDRRRRNVVVSEKQIMEEKRQGKLSEILGNIKEGDIITGIVSRIVEYGSFIDLGEGVEGLIHRNELSWSVINNPRDVIQPGQEIKCRVLKIDAEKGKISLSLRQMKEDPWGSVERRYEPSRTYQGTVKNLMDFGAFVELEEGIEGLVHISDLSWARNVRHPSDIVKSGEKIMVVVKEIDKDKKRISLSYKDTLPHPWEGIEKRLKVGDTVTGRVNNMTEFGAFIEIEPGIEGLLHVSDMDWVKKINHPSEALSKGQEISVKVLNVDIQNRRLSLGLKQTLQDPWDLIDTQFKVNDQVTGVVKNLAPYGAFIQLENGLEGLLHVSEFSWANDVKHPGDMLKIGDQVTVTIYLLDKAQKKIGLSLKRNSDDPWAGVERRYPVHSIQQGTVTVIDTNGVEVALDEKVHGYVHISQLSKTRVNTPEEVCKVGDHVNVKVLELDRKNRKLKLSMKEAIMDEETRELKKYQQESNEGFSDTLGDLMRDKFASLKRQLTDDKE